MAQVILAIPEAALEEFLVVLRHGLAASVGLVAEDTRQALETWAAEHVAYMARLRAKE